MKTWVAEKCPGPDGFPMTIYVLAWDFMKNETIRVMREFQDNHYFDWSLNTTFIMLIPKFAGKRGFKITDPLVSYHVFTRSSEKCWLID